MVLLHLLLTWQKYFKLNLGVAHYNHQLRGRASDDDERFIKNTCAKLGLACYSGKGDVRTNALTYQYSLEEAARIMREDFFETCLAKRKYDLLATGHTLDDQVETIFMRLLSGTGLEGLAGVRLRRNKFIRPLVFAKKEQIKEYAVQNEIQYREDLSNREVRFQRNKIRHKLLPYLKEEFGFDKFDSFLHIGLIVQEWVAEVEREVNSVFAKSVRFSKNQNKIRLDIPIYRKYFSGIQVRILEGILFRLLDRAEKLSYNQFQNFNQWLDKKKSGRYFWLHDKVRVSRRQQTLTFEKSLKSDEDKKIYVKLHPGQRFKSQELGIMIKISLTTIQKVQIQDVRTVEFLDARQIAFPLILRTWEPGDRFQPLGLSFQRKISDYLTEEKTLFLPKEAMLVLENQGEIICVPGCRISEKYKLTKQSQEVLKVKIQSS